jgi:hypothetical protein
MNSAFVLLLRWWSIGCEGVWNAHNFVAPWWIAKAAFETAIDRTCWQK